MRTRTRRFALILGALLLVVAVAPCVALADALPYPAPDPTPLPPTTQTAAATNQPTVGPYYAARLAAGHNSSPGQNFVWYLLESMIFVGPLLLTLLIEVPVIAIAGRGSAVSWKVGVLVNTLTNPIAVATVLLAGIPALQLTQGWIAPLLLVAAVEIAVVVVEWRIFRWALGWSNRRAILTSLIANALSFGIGLLVLTGGTPF